MVREGKWDLVETMVVIGAILGIMFAFLRQMGTWQAYPTLIAADWTVTIIEIVIWVIAFVVGILKTDVENWIGFALLLALGILTALLLANLAGIVLVIAAVLIILRREEY